MAKLELTKLDLKFFVHWALLIFVFFSTTAIFVNLATFAQDLTLFEDIEAPRSENGSRGSMRNSVGDIVSEPNFVLVGTARFGDYYSALINNGNERNIRLDEISGSMTFIPGYPGYQVIEVSSGEILIRYPTERDCVSNKNMGVSCGEDNVATLRLPESEPIKFVGSEGAQGENEAALKLNQGSEEQNTPRNPFAALLEGASNSNSSNEDTNSFTPRRISPEDIPSGMRVISTPFGDRLVEE